MKELFLTGDKLKKDLTKETDWEFDSLISVF